MHRSESGKNPRKDIVIYTPYRKFISLASILEGMWEVHVFFSDILGTVAAEKQKIVKIDGRITKKVIMVATSCR